jgi:hypothetical protein
VCDHCGCREFPAIAALTDQHRRIQHTAGRLRQAINSREPSSARRLLAALTDQLAAHLAAEEQGLFAELHADESIRTAIEQLCAEHTQLDAALRPPPAGEPDWTPVLAALDRLAAHIDKEEYGVCPAAVILLPTPAWDRITPLPPDDVPTGAVPPARGSADHPAARETGINRSPEPA